MRAKTLVMMAAMVMAAGLAAAQDAGAPSGNGIQPVFVAGNPSCASIGLGFGFKIDQSPNGTFTLTAGTETVLTGGAVSDPNNSVTISNSNDTYFDWTSTLGLDAVIVKGGPNANVYAYDPPSEASSDSGLHSPINPNNGTPYAISHIEFCYDYEVDVTKTAETSYTRTWDWNISKTVSPASWALFTGDSGTSGYTVAVTKTGSTDSDWAVSGTITIENNTPFAATITSVADAISGFGAVPVDCGVNFPYALAAGGSLQCSYATALPDGSDRTNTASVSTTGTVGGGSSEAAVAFGAPTTEVNASVNVIDSNGMFWMFATSGLQTYQRTFTCDADEGVANNTATIGETGQSASASVSVSCYDLDVTKDADTSFTRTWDWSIVKSAAQDEVLLSLGQTFTASYEVTIDAESVDSDWAVTGSIWITNNHPSSPASLVGVSDVVSPAINATVECPTHVVPAGGSIECSYSADLPDGAARTNTATATLQNVTIDSMGAATPSGTTDFSGSAGVSFGDPAEIVNECVELSDSMVEFTGGTQVCVSGGLPATFSYTVDIGPFTEADCEQQQQEFVNVASLTTEDSQTSLVEATASITVNLACDFGCTLTPGYWKTHSVYGPAPYDDTWMLIGEDTTFFLSGQSYYGVLWTAPKGGNAYYILAHAYIAAELNFLNGASVPPEVQDTFDAATALFNAYTPEYIGGLKNKPGDVTLRSEFIQYAATLDWYNNGLLGPGHCSE